jgi:hypothetical protein
MHIEIGGHRRINGIRINVVLRRPVRMLASLQASSALISAMRS